MTTPMTFVFITGSDNKRREFVRIVEQRESLRDKISILNYKLDLPELQGKTLQEIALAKITEARDQYKKASSNATLDVPIPFEKVDGIIVEDTALGCNAMGGLPGAYIKWFVEAIGAPDLHKMLVGFDDKTSAAYCTFGIWLAPHCSTTNKETGDFLVIQGLCQGTLVPSRGDLSFGWDSAFEPLVEEQAAAQIAIGKEFIVGTTPMLTYAEMSKDAKNAISHRGRALTKVLDHLESIL